MNLERLELFPKIVDTGTVSGAVSTELGEARGQA